MFGKLDKNESFPQMERAILEDWEKTRAFEATLSKGKADDSFIFYDGPPFATGLPHYGHLLAGTIKDIVPRYWTMKGKHVPRRFGWDCHGLPIESLIQSELKLDGVAAIREYGIGNFNEACRSKVLRYTSQWRQTVGRMGRWVDFDNDYKTMQPSFMETVWWVFKQCWDKGLIYQGYRIQPYSPALATPLSNFETNQGYKDRQDPSLTLIFPLLSEDPRFKGTNLLVWTTTPWTLPSNFAIAVGPEMEYSLVESEGNRFWCASTRVAAYFKEPNVVATCKGSDLVGLSYEPLFRLSDAWATKEELEKRYKIYPADFVSDEDGAGAVHIAPSFGEEDFQLGAELGLGLFDPLDSEGKFTDKVPMWKGLGAKEADKSIIAHLKERGRVFRHETFVHSYPHCWRTGVPLLYRALKTWFLKIDGEVTSAEGVTKTLKQWMIESNAQINWVPAHIKDGRFGKWIEGARDWNISRNRFWGTPLPVWIAEDGDMICVGSREQLELLTGKKVDDLHMHRIDPLEVRTKDGVHYDPEGKLYRRTSEVFDCWFESGSMPYAQNHYPFENREGFEKRFPADFIAEGLDQTRGWFYTLTVLAAALFQKPAFKNVVVNGIILAEDGQKMSKRLRNYPDPNDLLERTGADAIRLFLIDSAAVKAEDLRFSETGVREIVKTVLLPLWNAMLLFVTYAEADAAKGQLSWKPGDVRRSSNELDRWIVAKQQDLLAKIEAEMSAFRLYNVVPAIVQFIDELTNWYIRRSRRRFWKSENDGDKNDAYATLYEVLVTLSKTLAPFLPFLSEKMWQVLVRDAGRADGLVSVHQCGFPSADDAKRDPELVARMDMVRSIVEMGRSLRAQNNLKNRQPLSALTVAARDAAKRELVSRMRDIVCEELNVHELRIVEREDDLVRFSAKANFKALGSRLGKQMKSAAAQIAAFTSEQVSSLLQGGTVSIPEGEIALGDVVVVRQVQEGLVVEANADFTVALDTVVTPELDREGMARELLSRLQQCRKERDLRVTQRVKVSVFSEDADLRRALEEYGSWIASEVQADSLEIAEKAPVGADSGENEANGRKFCFTLTAI